MTETSVTDRGAHRKETEWQRIPSHRAFLCVYCTSSEFIAEGGQTSADRSHVNTWEEELQRLWMNAQRSRALSDNPRTITFQSWEQDFEKAIAKDNSLYCLVHFPSLKTLDANYERDGWIWASGGRRAERKVKWTILVWGACEGSLIPSIPACCSMQGIGEGRSPQGPSLRVLMMITAATRDSSQHVPPAGSIWWLLMLMRSRLWVWLWQWILD